MHETREAAPYPGHSIFQESFFFCTIKNVRDDPGAGDVYVETAVDGNSRMAFAKICSSRNAMNAADLLQTMILPFFEHYGVVVERVITPKTVEYYGLPPVHPFETLLITSHIEHQHFDSAAHNTNSFCEQFFHVLQREFFTPALRKRFHQSVDTLQHDLDAFVKTYNSERISFEIDAENRPPLRVFLDAVGI
jgi:hypothetical protein